MKIAVLSVILAAASATELRGSNNRILSGYEFEIEQCGRRKGSVGIRPRVPDNSSIEAVNTVTGKSIKADNLSSESNAIPLTAKEEAFFADAFRNKDRSQKIKMSVNGGPFTACSYNTPIGLDIDGSGAVERIQGSFFIDISGDGDIEHLHEWFAPTEGILIDAALATKDGINSKEHFAGNHFVADSRELKKHSGAITGKHLFGDMGSLFSDGFQKLTVHDGNKNGSVSRSELEGLAVWVDANSDAKVDAGELNTLASYGIVGISTSHKKSISSAKLMDGSVMVTEDLFFSR